MLFNLAIIVFQIISISSMTIEPFIFAQTAKQCTKHYEISSDGKFVLCSNSTSTHIISWSDQNNNYTLFQEFYQKSFLPAYIQMTQDGRMAAFLEMNQSTFSTTLKLEIYYRQNMSDRFELVQTIDKDAYHFHISSNHRYLVTSEDTGFLMQFNQKLKEFIPKNILGNMKNAALRVSPGGDIVVGIQPNGGVSIYYKKQNDRSFKNINGLDNDLRIRHCNAYFDSYPTIIISGSSYSNKFNFISQFNINTQRIQMVYNFTLRNSLGQEIYAGKSQFSRNAQYVAFITHESQSGYALGRLQNGKFNLITNQTYWVPLNQAWDISFQYVQQQQREYHTITYLQGTEIYYRQFGNRLQRNIQVQTNGNRQSSSRNSNNFKYSQSCQSMIGSTGIQLQNNQCQCWPHYYWEKEVQSCYPTCLRKFSVGFDPQNFQKCRCRPPTKWNDIIFDCYLPCEQIEGSTGQYQSQQTCECLNGYNWNKKVLGCQKNDFIQKAVPQCEPGTFYSTTINDCIRDCSQIQFSTGFNIDPDTCQCQLGYRWQFPTCIKFR